MKKDEIVTEGQDWLVLVALGTFLVIVVVVLGVAWWRF